MAVEKQLVTVNDYADFYRSEVGANVFPKNADYRKYCDCEVSQELHDEWKSTNAFDDGIFVMCGRLRNNIRKLGGHLLCIILKNKKAIDEFFAKSIDEISKDTLVERDSEGNVYVYFTSRIPVASQQGVKGDDNIPDFEIFGYANNGLVEAPCNILSVKTIEYNQDIGRLVYDNCKNYNIPFGNENNKTIKTIEVSTKQYYIELFRKLGFNCFPIPIRTDDTPNQKKKAGDYRYNAENTEYGQIIKENENYGILPTKEGLNAWVDFDDKEEYRQFADLMRKEGYIVIETPHGWHIPVNNLGTVASKKNLCNFTIRNKPLIEIQGVEQYVVGCGSKFVDSETKEILEYKSVGGNKIWDFQGKPFVEFVDYICNSCNVEDKKKDNTSHYQHLRNKFKDRKLPTEGQSNDYFMQAAVVLLDKGRNLEDAITEIELVFNQWKETEFYTGRLWSDELKKIQEVYENKDKYSLGSGRKKGVGDFDIEGVVDDILKSKNVFSDKELKEIHENKNGFLEVINETLASELKPRYRNMTKQNYDNLLFSLKNLAPDMPEADKNLIRFPNGGFDNLTRKFIEAKDIPSDRIAEIGFTQYNYLPGKKSNEPKEFLKFFKDYDKKEWSRIKMGLRAILSGHKDFRLTVFYGISNVGKSLMLAILCGILGDRYALQIDYNDLMNDRASKAKVSGKIMIVIQEMPDKEINLADLKGLLGESKLSIRGYMSDLKTEDNKVKWFATTNNLAPVKDSDKNAMFTNRLSLCQNTRTEPYPYDPDMEDRIIKAEGEKILSWILNLTDEECAYEDSKTVREAWEVESVPEIKWLESEYQETDIETDKLAVRSMKKLFEAQWKDGKQKRDMEGFSNSIQSLGYPVFKGTVKFIQQKFKPVDLSNNEKKEHSAGLQANQS